jgi:hypothetical protein
MGDAFEPIAFGLDCLSGNACKIVFKNRTKIKIGLIIPGIVIHIVFKKITYGIADRLSFPESVS